MNLVSLTGVIFYLWKAPSCVTKMLEVETRYIKFPLFERPILDVNSVGLPSFWTDYGICPCLFISALRARLRYAIPPPAPPPRPEELPPSML